MLGSVTLTSVSVAGNTATQGGGIASQSALAITSGSVTRNTATSEGGGIYNEGGTVTLTRAGVTGNQVDNCYPEGTIAGCTR
jgi:predicted outer membrane repeat protein